MLKDLGNGTVSYTFAKTGLTVTNKDNILQKSSIIRGYAVKVLSKRFEGLSAEDNERIVEKLRLCIPFDKIAILKGHDSITEEHFGFIISSIMESNIIKEKGISSADFHNHDMN